MKPKLYLIDGTALLYRAHFAFIHNPLINSRGEHTSAIYGLMNSLMSLIDKSQAQYLAIAFDRKAPTFRHIEYEAYKANRPPMPDDLIAQIAVVNELMDSIGIAQAGKDGYEADDALGTLGEYFKPDFEVIYVTSDKDYCQLVDENSKLYDPFKDSYLDHDAIFAKYGVWPEQFIDYLALMGDSSDNIPGVRGIGPKGALALLTEYGSLDSIYQHLDEIKPTISKKLVESQDNAFLSRKLATIELKADLEIPKVESLRFDPLAFNKILPLLKNYELLSLVRRLEAKYPEIKQIQKEVVEELYQDDIFGFQPETSIETSVAESSAKPDPVSSSFAAILVDEQSFPSFWDKLSSSQKVAIDTETDSLDPITTSLVGMSFCFDDLEAYYLPLGHQFYDNLPLAETLVQIKTALADKLLIGHNLKFDLSVLEHNGLKLENPIFDTMLAAYILEAGLYSYSLDDCAKRELNHDMIPISALIGSGKKQITFDLVNPTEAAVYAAEDAWATWRLHQIYAMRLENSPARNVFYDIEMPLLWVIKAMETTGVSIDTSILGEISQHLNTEMNKLSEEIFALSGYSFNLNSTQQLAKLLFEDMKLPSKKKTKSGFSTDNSVLEELADDYDIARKLIEYRQLTKLENTYVSALPRLINSQTDKIHSSFNQCVASTGRLSSTNPNLQNIPVRTSIGREIRKAFVVKDPDWVIMAADYSQIELRLLALMSSDAVLIKAFQDEVDIHKQTAAQIHNVPLAEVTADMRRAAKTINFGLMYGMGSTKLSKELGISRSDAKAMIDTYFAQFPSIRDFTHQCVEQARYSMQASTMFGRILSLPGINSKNKGISSEAERVAVNMPIQGTAADLIKRAMITIHKQIQGDSRIKMIMQVHDELVFEVRKDYLDTAKALISAAMEGALPLEYSQKVKLAVEIGSGKNWYEAH